MKKDIIDIARQLQDDLYSAERLHARACDVKDDIFEALSILEEARKKAVLRCVKNALPHLRGKIGNGAMYTRANLLAAASTGLPQFIPDWIRYADRLATK
jgi:hypothetical protein